MSRLNDSNAASLAASFAVSSRIFSSSHSTRALCCVLASAPKRDAAAEEEEGRPIMSEPVWGADVSAIQGVVPFGDLAALGASFVYLRCKVGNDYGDSTGRSRRSTP